MTEKGEPSGSELGFISRRQALRAAGVAGVTGLAGCLHKKRPCDLSVTKAHVGEAVSYGGTTEFEITVCNEGDQTCKDQVTVTDDLPAGVTYASDSGSGWSCTDNGGTVTCVHNNQGGLAGGDCLPTLTLTVDIGSQDEVGPEMANCATVEQGDPDLGHKTDCVTVPVETLGGTCDLTISKQLEGDVVVEGATATFLIEVCNEGEGPCRDEVTVVDGLPAGVTFGSVSGSGWTGSVSGGTVTATHPNSGGLAAGDCLPALELTVEIGPIAETGDRIRNCAGLDVADADASNNRDCVDVPVQSDGGDCDLSISKRLDGDVVTEGETATFLIEVCNEGDGTCPDEVTVVDGLPAGLTYGSVSGSGWSGSESSGTVTATHPNTGGLAAGDCLPVLELTVEVGSMDETGDRIRNCAGLEVADVVASNNRDCVDVPVQQGGGDCDLSIEKTHTGGGVAAAEETTTFEIAVCNDGDGTCPDEVTVVDSLPNGVSFVAGSGSAWTVSESGGTVTTTHPNTGGLAAGDCLPILTLDVQLGSIDETGDQIRNCARLQSADDNTENNGDCAVVAVTQSVQGCNGLELEKVAATQFTYGQQESYELTVCNPTDQPCEGAITVTDELPGGMSFVSVSGSGWSASASGGVVTATHPNNGTLAAGDCLPTLTLNVQLVPASQFPGGSDAVQNCAELLADGAVVDEACVTHVIFNV